MNSLSKFSANNKNLLIIMSKKILKINPKQYGFGSVYIALN